MNIAIGLANGSVSIPFRELIQILAGGETENARVFWQIRFPRVMGGVLVGALLALSGCILQAVLQNPIADPGVLGISSGASLSAVLIMILFPGMSSLVIPLAFAGGLASFALVALLTYRNGMKPVQVILAGVAMSAVWGGFQAILLTAYSDRLVGVMDWLNGALGNVTWPDLRLMAGLTFPFIILLFFLAKPLNLLLLGEDVMHNLGVSVLLYRFLFASMAVYFAATAVAFTGTISFVGLMVPHIGRLLIGNHQSRLIPVALLLGGNLLLAADTISRVLIAPREIPVGTVMSLLGGPFFLYLLLRQGKKGDVG
jgi:FecCD transport family.